MKTRVRLFYKLFFFSDLCFITGRTQSCGWACPGVVLLHGMGFPLLPRSSTNSRQCLLKTGAAVAGAAGSAWESSACVSISCVCVSFNLDKMCGFCSEFWMKNKIKSKTWEVRSSCAWSVSRWAERGSRDWVGVGAALCLFWVVLPLDRFLIISLHVLCS